MFKHSAAFMTRCYAELKRILDSPFAREIPLDGQALILYRIRAILEKDPTRVPKLYRMNGKWVVR